MATAGRLASMTETKDPSVDYRRKVVRLYFGLRVLFLVTSLLSLVLLRYGVLELAGVSAPQITEMWWAWALFGGWSFVLFLTARASRQPASLGWIDGLIWISLVVDGLAIFLAARASGAAASPFYHSVYFLIAVHSYHLGAPGPKPSPGARQGLPARYFLLSALPSVVVAMGIYCLLADGSFGRLQYLFELGLQSVTAASFAWLGLQDQERSRRLAEQGREVAAATVRVQDARVELERTLGGLEEAKSYQRQLLQALGRVTSIAEMKDQESLEKGLKGLAQQIGNTLEAEYCAIGMVRDSTVEDLAHLD